MNDFEFAFAEPMALPLFDNGLWPNGDSEATVTGNNDAGYLLQSGAFTEMSNADCLGFDPIGFNNHPTTSQDVTFTGNLEDAGLLYSNGHDFHPDNAPLLIPTTEERGHKRGRDELEQDDVAEIEIVESPTTTATSTPNTAMANPNTNETVPMLRSPTSLSRVAPTFECPFNGCKCRLKYGSDLVRHLFKREHLPAMRSILKDAGMAEAFRCTQCHQAHVSYTELREHRRSHADAANHHHHQRMTNQAFISKIALLVESYPGRWYHDGLQDRVVCVLSNGQPSCEVALAMSS